MKRKYGIGLIAFIFAISLAAFTAPEKSTVIGTHVFEFNSSLSYTLANVTNNANWEYVGDISSNPLCSGTEKACRIVVGDDYVDNATNPMEIIDITLTASLNSNGDAKLTGINNPTVNDFSNQP